MFDWDAQRTKTEKGSIHGRVESPHNPEESRAGIKNKEQDRHDTGTVEGHFLSWGGAFLFALIPFPIIIFVEGTKKELLTFSFSSLFFAGGLSRFMAASKILGEETAGAGGAAGASAGANAGANGAGERLVGEGGKGKGWEG